MKIERVRLGPFGSIADRELEFKDGLNVILGPNEAGKSTVFHAIQHVLFTPAGLTPSKFDTILKKYLPVGGGDTIHAEIELQYHNRRFILRRTWGVKSSSEFILPDGALVRDDTTIAEILEPMLDAKEGTYRSVLMTYQTGLRDTIGELKATYVETVHTLGDILRRSLLETDGVSVDLFKKNLQDLCDEYANHWDFKQQKPEKGKRYKKKVGLILNAFYSMQDTESSLHHALDYEEKLDRINQKISRLSEQIKQKQRYIEENREIVEAARRRKGLEKDLRLAQNDIEVLKEANSRWPVLKSRIVEIDKSLRELERRRESLEKQKVEAETQEKNKSLLEKYARARERKATLIKAEEGLSKVKKLTREDLDSIQKACFDLQNAETGLASGKLSLDVTAKKDISLSIQKDSDQEFMQEVKKGKKIKADAGAKITVDHRDFRMAIQSGEGDRDDRIKSLDSIKKKVNDLFARYEIDSYEKARELNMIYDGACREVEAARKSLTDELGENIFDELESKVKKLGPEKKSAPLTDIVAGMTTIINDIDNLNKERDEAKQTVGKFKALYHTHDELLEHLSETMKKKKTVSEELKTLPSLPNGAADAEMFINQFEDAKKQKDELNRSERDVLLERAHLERDAPELSAEEYKKQLSHACEAFDMVLQKGIAIKRIIDHTERIVEGLDSSTYRGIEKKLEEYITLITDDKYRKITMEESLPEGIVRRDGVPLHYSLLSVGTRDVLALALRLSMAHYFLQDTDGFLMMDDPLVNLDPDRQHRAAEAIKGFCKERQLLLFSCHPIHAQLLGGNVITL